MRIAGEILLFEVREPVTVEDFVDFNNLGGILLCDGGQIAVVEIVVQLAQNGGNEQPEISII